MAPRLGIVLALALTLFGSRAAGAHTATVPDTAPTLQAAADDPLVDTILVRSGNWAGATFHNTPITVTAAPSATPTVGKLDFENVHATVSRLHVAGRITMPSGVASFTSCTVDSGMSLNSDGTVTSCTVTGTIGIGGLHATIIGCTVFGTISFDISGYARIRDNQVLGPGAIGISGANSDGGVSVTGNTVFGVATGIFCIGPVDSIASNIVSHPNGTGIFLRGTGLVDSNLVDHAAGYGIDVDPTTSSGTRALVVQDNTVKTPASIGIRATHGLGVEQALTLLRNRVTDAGANGIDARGAPLDVIGNTVLRGTGSGMALVNARNVRFNVVGRAADRGIVVASAVSPAVFSSNTVYACTASAFDLTAAATDSVDHDIAAGNGGYGLVWHPATGPRHGCNDWYVNTLGETNGIPPGGPEFAVDPLFCNEGSDDIHLAANSPMLSAGACGLVGALGQGCAAVSVGPGARVAEWTIAPQPARSAITFARRGVDPARIAVYDVSGRLRFERRLAAGERTFVWSGADGAGARLAPGIYLVRLESAASASERHIVLLR